jgi:hypothetical protein
MAPLLECTNLKKRRILVNKPKRLGPAGLSGEERASAGELGRLG